MYYKVADYLRIISSLGPLYLYMLAQRSWDLREWVDVNGGYQLLHT